MPCCSACTGASVGISHNVSFTMQLLAEEVGIAVPALFSEGRPLLDGDIHGVGKNVDRIEPDLLGLANAELGALPGLGKRGVDEA